MMSETQTPEQQAVTQYNKTADPAWKLSEAYPTQEHDDETYALNHPEDSEYEVNDGVCQDYTKPSTHIKAPRAFYRSDYGRAARLIQAARHVPGDIYTAKSDEQLDSVTALAFTIVQTFEADSDHFDAGEFMDATQLPARPQVIEAYPSDPEENEGPAEMAALEAFIDPE